MRIIGGEEIIFPRKNVVNAGPSGLNQQRGGDAAARRHAAEVERFLNMFSVSVPCPETGGLMRGVAEHPSHLLSVQARGTTGGGGRAKKRRNTVGAPVAKAAGITAQPGCDCEGAWESSVSSACASMPLVRAASIGPQAKFEATTVATSLPPYARAN